MQREALNDDGSCLGDDFLRLRLGEPAGIGKTGIQLLQPIELGEIRRRRDEERDIRPALARLAQFDEAHVLRALGERLVVLEQLVPVGELAVGSHLIAEELLR